MPNWVITTDSCSDLTAEQVKTMGLRVIPLSVEIEGKTYFHHPDERELSITDFYAKLRNKSVATTSLINVGAFLEFFESLLQENQDILYIGFSSGLSGTFQSAQIAAKELKIQYPDRKIQLVDSLCASMGQGLLVWHAWNQKQAGKTMEEITSWLESNKLHLCHLFTVDDLGTLKRGGRLSDSAAFLGTLLKVKPILHVNDQGKLVALQKARGRRSSLSTMVDLMSDHVTDAPKQTVFISHGDCLAEAEQVGQMITDRFHVQAIVYNHIGPIIGAHSGPGTIAVFFLGNVR